MMSAIDQGTPRALLFATAVSSFAAFAKSDLPPPETCAAPPLFDVELGFGAGLVKEIESPVYATAVGLVLYAFKNTASNTLHSYIDEQEEESPLM